MVQVAQLRALQAVVETGSFAAAGAKLSLTASAVSQQIAALEKALGLRLFERRSQGVRVSAAAVALALRVGNVLAQLDLLHQEAAALAAGARGLVRLGSFPTAGARLLPESLARLARGRRGIETLLDEGEPEDLLQRLSDGVLDYAVVYCYDALPSTWPDTVTPIPLMHESLVLMAPEQLPEFAADLSDVAEQTWIASQRESAGWRSLERMCLGAGFSPRVAYRSNDYDVVRGMVAAGLGVAVLPALAFTETAGTRAVAVRGVGAHRTTYLAVRDGEPPGRLESVRRAFRSTAKALASPILRPL